ncbi:NAD-dependent methanol dehydrogenase [compost metagenome]
MKRYAEIAEFLGESTYGLSTRDAAELAIDTIVRLSSDLGISGGFKAMGAREEDIETLAKNAMKDATSVTNPRRPKLEEVIQIITNAM